MSSRKSAIRLRMRRRSISSFVSPGPRTPIAPPTPAAPALRVPPACWENATPRPVRRGRRYSNWASSTCNRPSRVRACCAKMSNIKAVRSMTRALSIFSRLRCCEGDNSSSKITRSNPNCFSRSPSSCARPLPM